MKSKLAYVGLVMATFVLPSWVSAADADTDRDHPMTYVKDSIITTKVKAKLANERMNSLTHIKVDTDNKGVVWLTGTAKTQADAESAVSIARATDGVTSVNSNIQIKKDD